MTKPKLTTKQIELLRKLVNANADGSIRWLNLRQQESRSGTLLEKMGLTRWEFGEPPAGSRRQTFSPSDKTLHVTAAGKEALKEIGE